MKRTNNVIWGILIIVLGLLLGARALGLLNFEIFFDGWWTLFIIIPCAVGLFTNSEKTSNLIGLLIGVALLLGCMDVLSFKVIWKLALPIIIVLIGINILFKGFQNSTEIKQITSNKKLRQCTAIFTGQELDYTGQVFDGAELTAVFGGIELDLRNAIIEKDAVINVCAVFGGIDILMPDNVSIKKSVSAVFGGVDNKKHKNNAENAVTEYINGICLFGGVDIK